MEKFEIITVTVVASLILFASSELRNMRLEQASLPEITRQAQADQRDKALEKIFEAEFPAESPKSAAPVRHIGQRIVEHIVQPIVQRASVSKLKLAPLAAREIQRFHLLTELDLRLTPRVIVMPFAEQYEVAAPLFETDDIDAGARQSSSVSLAKIYL